MGEPEATGPTIDICPRCLYALHGLPRSHTCPECGQRYDERSRLWRGSRISAVLWRARRNFIPLAALIVIAGLADFRSVFTALVILGIAGVGIHLAYLTLRFEYVGPLIACVPDGLYVRDALFKPLGRDTKHHEDLISWAAVEQVAPHVELPRACVIINGQDWEVIGPFRTQQEVADFVAVVRLHIGADGAWQDSGSDAAITREP